MMFFGTIVFHDRDDIMYTKPLLPFPTKYFSFTMECLLDYLYTPPKIGFFENPIGYVAIVGQTSKFSFI